MTFRTPFQELNMEKKLYFVLRHVFTTQHLFIYSVKNIEQRIKHQDYEYRYLIRDFKYKSYPKRNCSQHQDIEDIKSYLLTLLTTVKSSHDTPYFF